MTEEASEGRPVRLRLDGTSVYVWPHRPDWCVPNEEGDFVLDTFLRTSDEPFTVDAYAREFGVDPEQARWRVHRFLGRLKTAPAEPYAGRSAALSLKRLGECWLHLTNQCNARCKHCMFACRPGEGAELDTSVALSVIRDALRLGCRLFYFTGGEPTICNAFPRLVRCILQEPDAHVVVLTNGLMSDTLVSVFEREPHERIHVQVSVDGSEATHDALRGAGAHRRMVADVARLRGAGFPVTLAMTVHRGNVDEMPAAVQLASDLHLRNLHYLWLFRRGEADDEDFATPKRIWPRLREAAQLAEAREVLVDNMEIVRSQVFSLPGTRFDLSNAGWESLAVDPAGDVYPSPALIGDQRAACGNVRQGLEAVWRESPRLRELRSSSLAHSAAYRANPLRFLVGGGDVDHSFTTAGAFVGHDPYVELYNRIALWLIARDAARFQAGPGSGLRLRMGEYLHECGEDGSGVRFTHSNCVLSLPGKDGHSLVGDFYRAAAAQANEEILNPVQYAQEDVSFIPEGARVRSYGCGSPVADADITPGETVVDLGCGAGMECFLAAAKVGASGRVVGVDMLPTMLDRARGAADAVADHLGYANVTFRKGLLEDLPLPEASADVVISNCVINLSPHKRKAFSEIHRVLRPGGRFVISDVASQEEIPLEIQYNQKLRGECLGGAFRVDRLFDLLADVGFGQATLLKRFPYRRVRGHQFYSITYSACRPTTDASPVVYRGPFKAVVTDEGALIERGQVGRLPWQPERPLGDQVFVLDDRGNVTNVEQQMTCACFGANPQSAAPPAPAHPRSRTDCMVCGARLTYLERERAQRCHYCGEEKMANAVCAEGHFVCDACHGADAAQRMRELLLAATERDTVALLKRIRREASLPVHGPEHHMLVPGIVVIAFRNSGGRAGEAEFDSALQRGASIAGGACAFLGVCGAAAGMGTGFSVLLGATPYKARERQILQQAVAEALADIAALEAPRCCQRDCWIALRKAAEVSDRVLGVHLSADAPLSCDQFSLNQECIRQQCPLWTVNKPEARPARTVGRAAGS